MGRAVSLTLAAAGCRVAVVDIDQSAAQITASELERSGSETIAIRADATDEKQVVAAVETAEGRFGCPDISASVIGMATWGSLLEMPLAQWERDQALNLRAHFLVGRTVAARMMAAGRTGSIAFVASVSGLQSARNHASYGAAKAGLANLVKSMAVEWAPAGIRVNALAPGAVRTQRSPQDPKVEAALSRRIPMGRFASVEEIASGMLFLLSDLASYVTGHTLLVDGGWMAAPLLQDSDRS